MTTTYTENFGLALPDFRQGPWHDQVNNDFIKIDTLLFNAISQASVELWTNNTAYTPGISSLDGVDATVWVCVVAHTSAPSGTFAADRTAHPTYWTRLLTGFAPRGEWKNSTQYFPYDLAYQSSYGIFGLCTVQHTSNPSGSIKNDSAFWAYLCDLSSMSLATANVVSYNHTISPTLTANNVQDAIDQLAAQVVAINNVNVTQGNNITSLLNGAMLLAGNQTITGGFRFTPFNMGTGAGAVSPDPTKGNYQYINNTAAFTIIAPATDCAIDILIINGANAGVVTLQGFIAGINTGDLLTTTNSHRFIVSIRRINGIATYVIKALQ